ncbi:MAG: DUF1838 family protein [Rhodospirillaceae bacterium]|nr:DUF1838 family protein [Rhodospirillaceae bacterium]
MNLARRAVLAGVAASGAVGAGAAVNGVGADPAFIDRAHRSLVYARDQRVVFWFKHGIKYGVVDGDVTPLWAMEVLFIQRVLAHRAEDFDMVSLEAVFMTDVATGALLDEWTNPYTGARLPVPNRLFGPERQTINSHSAAVLSEMPGVRIDRRHTIGPATLVGDDVWLPVDTSSTVRRAVGDAPPFRVHDLETFHGSRRAIDNPGVMSAPATAALHIISSWQTWLAMDGRSGSQVTRLTARKVFALDDIPGSTLALLKRTYPEIAANPAAALERAPESFERR